VAKRLQIVEAIRSTSATRNNVVNVCRWHWTAIVDAERISAQRMRAQKHQSQSSPARVVSSRVRRLSLCIAAHLVLDVTVAARSLASLHQPWTSEHPTHPGRSLGHDSLLYQPAAQPMTLRLDGIALRPPILEHHL
jgi:hypothetical protein